MSINRSLDAVDRVILFHLEREGRLSNVELADRVGLTPPPCLRRVRRLEAEGYITGYHAALNPELTGRAFEVMVAVDINATDQQTTEAFEAAVVEFDEVVAARRLFGQPDYLVHVGVADGAVLEAVLKSQLHGLAR